MQKKRDRKQLELLEAELSEVDSPKLAQLKAPPKPTNRGGFLSEDLRCVPFGDTNIFDLTINIMDGILDSLPFETACMQSGARPEEVRQLMDANIPVARALNYAYASNALKWIKKLESSGDWKATAYYLEHGVPTIFGDAKPIAVPRVETKVSTKNNVQDLSDEELLAIIGGQ